MLLSLLLALFALQSVFAVCGIICTLRTVARRPTVQVADLRYFGPR